MLRLRYTIGLGRVGGRARHMAVGRAQAAQRGRDYRQQAYRISESRLPSIAKNLAGVTLTGPVRLTSIDGPALRIWKSRWQPNLPEAVADWDWERLHAGYANDAYRFEMAIWSDEELCGLAIGKPSNGGTFLRVDVMQGAPILHPLKNLVRLFVVDTAIAYADCLDINELRLMRPLEPLWAIYGAMGFDLAGRTQRPPYCSLRLDQ